MVKTDLKDEEKEFVSEFEKYINSDDKDLDALENVEATGLAICSARNLLGKISYRGLYEKLKAEQIAA